MQVTHAYSNRPTDQKLGFVVRAALSALVVAIAVGAASAAAPQPTPEIVAEVVDHYFAQLPGYKPGDLVTQSSVAGALSALAAGGWEVPEPNAIIKRTLADNSFIARALSTPEGRQFMRKIARFPGTYTRLDRLSTISNGEEVVEQLIHAKGGDTMIQYMATTQGGHNLGKMMAGAQHGVDLNKPTGRIYTAADLVAELERAYGAEDR